MIYNIRWLRIFYKLWFKIQLSTWTGARNPKTESCQNADMAVTGGTGSCHLAPAVSPAPHKCCFMYMPVMDTQYHWWDFFNIIGPYNMNFLLVCVRLSLYVSAVSIYCAQGTRVCYLRRVFSWRSVPSQTAQNSSHPMTTVSYFVNGCMHGYSIIS